MHSKSIRLPLCAWFSLLVVHFAAASDPGPTPPSTWPPPVPTPTPPESVSITGTVNSAPNPDELIPVVVSYGEGLETRANIAQGLMFPVGVPQQKSVTVTLLLPSTYAGQPVKLALYDGGLVGPAGPPGIPIGPPGTRSGGIEALTFVLNAARDGTVHFNFEAGALLGLYRLAAAIGPNRYLLQFYAVRPATSALLQFPIRRRALLRCPVLTQ